MNDRVQALAGSIYEEFEQVRSKQVMLSDYLPYPVPIVRIKRKSVPGIHRLSVAVQLPGTSIRHRVPNPTPPSSTQGKAGRNHLNEEITPLLPTGKGERFSRTISNLGHAALLRQCELAL
jgi:hypothetical protein